jgi:hypothetical protein
MQGGVYWSHVGRDGREEECEECTQQCLARLEIENTNAFNSRTEMLF